VANVDYACCTDSTRLANADIDCRDLEGRRFYESAGGIAHDRDSAAQHAVVSFRPEIIDHMAHPVMRLDPLPHFGCNDPSRSIGVGYGEDNREACLIEPRQELVNLPLNLLVFERDRMKCHEKKWSLNIHSKAAI
jgi:hypothetical protein